MLVRQFAGVVDRKGGVHRVGHPRCAQQTGVAVAKYGEGGVKWRGMAAPKEGCPICGRAFCENVIDRVEGWEEGEDK